MLNLDELTALCRQCGAEIETDVPLSGLTTFQIGGPCAALVTLPDQESTNTIFSYLRENHVPYTLIGRGSNLLCPDEGYTGVVLRFGGEKMQAISLDETGTGIYCGAGASLQKLCRFALDNGLTGLEFAYGIPGSVGGAVFMNAGAYDGEMSQAVADVTAYQPDGRFCVMQNPELDFSYRHSIFTDHRDWAVLSVHFMLKKGDPEAIRAKMQDLIGRRKSKQPLEFPSAGSTFKRPKGSYASKLIDECGLKGYTVGGAQVSEKHAGFVINRGGATFADVMALCQYVQETVQKQTGFVLELEPEIIKA